MNSSLCCSLLRILRVVCNLSLSPSTSVYSVLIVSSHTISESRPHDTEFVRKDRDDKLERTLVQGEAPGEQYLGHNKQQQQQC